ncbi:MAG: hypothetical protein GQ552_02270, partial [Flavobacteriaceae bacterium]|nr:hypothetical protein [Flavobacteriaceae bacterium]
MKKRFTLIPLSGIIFLTLIMTTGLLGFKKINKVYYNLPIANTIATVNKEIIPFEIIYTPTIENDFIAFREAVAFKESQG